MQDGECFLQAESDHQDFTRTIAQSHPTNVRDHHLLSPAGQQFIPSKLRLIEDSAAQLYDPQPSCFRFFIGSIWRARWLKNLERDRHTKWIERLSSIVPV